jgi:tetratricopeptide (TPR) repeat protein
VTVVIKNTESGITYTVKTDRNGHFVQIGLRTGIYDISFQVKDSGGKVIASYEMNARVAGGEEARADVNFKDVLAKQTAEQAEARRKQEETRKKFEGMKEHFDLGMVALNGTKQARDDMMKLPADQRGPAKEKLDALYATAVTEFETAQKAAPEKDPNLHLIYYQQGAAYDQSGKSDEAIAAYQKAIELKPTEAGYYNNLGNVFARTGKFQEAQAAYQKSVDLDPSKATSVWLNYGISLYNGNRLKEAVDPLRKATALDPKNANAWYLLGASLMASMDTRKEGDKLIPIVQPGTVEAYQKYLELAPTGHFADDAKASLAALESMAGGIETKVKTTTTKPKKKP